MEEIAEHTTCNSRRSAEIELLRFFMVLVVVFFHQYEAILGRGFLAVEFFFILTGYLTMKSVSRSLLTNLEMPSLGLFLKRKIAGFYPELLIACVGGCLFNLYLTMIGKSSFASMITECLTNILQNLALLRMTGIAGTSAVCVPAWYLSSMIIALILVIPFIFRFKNLYLRIVIALFLYCCVLHNLEGLEKNSYADWVHYTYGGNLRAIAGILLGTVAYVIVEKSKNYQFSIPMKVVISCGIILCCFLFIAILFCKGGALDGVAVCIHFFLIIALFSRNTLFGFCFDNKTIYTWCCKLGKFSLPLYLGHIFPLYVYRSLPQQHELSLGLYLFLAVISGAIIAIGAHYVRKYMSLFLVLSINQR